MNTILSNLQTTLPRKLLFLLAAGLLVRILFITFHQRALISDEKEYDQLAYSLSSAGTYEVDGRPTAYRPVGYPAFVAAIYTLAGHSPIAVKTVQAIIDCLTAMLMFLLLAKYNPPAAAWASGFWLFYPPALLYCNFLLSETLTAFVLVLSIYLLKELAPGKKTLSIIFGLLLGFLVLTKPFFLLFFLLLPFVFWMGRFPFALDKWIVLGLVLATGPWVVRNAVIMGYPTLATNSGINLLIGNNQNTTGAYNVNLPDDDIDALGDEVEADHLASRKALDYIREHPGRFFINGAKKLAHLFSSQGGLLVWSFHDSPEDPSTRYAAKYKAIPMVLTILVNLPFVALLLFGAVGIFVSQREIIWWSFLTLLVIWCGVHFIFFGGSRFLFPLFPFFSMFSTVALRNIRVHLRQLTTAQTILITLIILSLLGVWASEFALVHSA